MPKVEYQFERIQLNPNTMTNLVRDESAQLVAVDKQTAIFLTRRTVYTPEEAAAMEPPDVPIGTRRVEEQAKVDAEIEAIKEAMEAVEEDEEEVEDE